ncbi:copper homeostasis protein CutC [Streptomyces pathocidini]|uniref:Copper homeostasis protein cutC homolog n=1 Tax=Streptomyces pathocidini TaxID=1650571 RepID=A0ABW7UWI3_9ACTN|nr:copper homeostasis protein CutC [Streptomyces pathocidini]
MSRPILEVIALNATDAAAAQAGGADRLELVTDMAADGLTPPREVFAEIRAAVDIPLRVMLRPSAGFAAGGARALHALCAEAEALRAEGADEFVLGFLDHEGHPDLVAVEELVAVIEPCRWTFHRAIDHATHRDTLRKQLAGLPGLDTYLTAGSPSGVDEGLPTLLAEAAKSGEPGYEPRLLVGGGLRLDHLPTLRAAGITAFHVGTAARPEGWSHPVSPTAVEQWRTAL